MTIEFGNELTDEKQYWQFMMNMSKDRVWDCERVTQEEAGTIDTDLKLNFLKKYITILLMLLGSLYLLD